MPQQDSLRKRGSGDSASRLEAPDPQELEDYEESPSKKGREKEQSWAATQEFLRQWIMNLVARIRRGDYPSAAEIKQGFLTFLAYCKQKGTPLVISCRHRTVTLALTCQQKTTTLAGRLRRGEVTKEEVQTYVLETYAGCKNKAMPFIISTRDTLVPLAFTCQQKTMALVERLKRGDIPSVAEIRQAGLSFTSWVAKSEQRFLTFLFGVGIAFLLFQMLLFPWGTSEKPTFIMHVGLHKSGTTFLQFALCKFALLHGMLVWLFGCLVDGVTHSLLIFLDTGGPDEDRHGIFNQTALTKRILERDNLVYLGTSPLELQKCLRHHHTSFFKENVGIEGKSISQ
jgi:hypothetical protein